MLGIVCEAIPLVAAAAAPFNPQQFPHIAKEANVAIYEIQVTKGKATVLVDTDEIPTEMYEQALQLGLKHMINLGASKITKANYPKPEELQAAAMAQAEVQIGLIKEGKIRGAAAKKDGKVPGKVMTEARRLARNLIKDEMKRQGIRVSHVETSEITKAVNQLLSEDDSLIKQAEVNLAEREKVPVKIDVKALIKESPTKVAAAEAKKAKARAATSAKQAAMVQPKARPTIQPTVRH